MTIERTPRLKLYTETDDELIDQFEYNWPILDKYADSLQVNAGVTPSDSELFEGCIVAEKTGGKLWVTKDVGAFDKSWVAYPWLIEVTKLVIVPTHQGTVRGFDGVVASGCVNSSVDDLDVGNDKQIKIPVPGIYSIQYQFSIPPVGSGAATSTVNFEVLIGGAQIHEGMKKFVTDGHSTIFGTAFNFPFNAGDLLGFKFAEWGAISAVTGTVTLSAAMVSPLY